MTVDVPEALSKLAVRLAGDGARAVDPQRLTGGASMETWAFAIESGKGREDLILRRRSAPFDPESSRSTSLAAEAALIQAARAAGAPAPPLVHLCDAADGLGEAHVTRRIAGETLGRRINGDAKFDAVRGDLARQCGPERMATERVAVVERPSFATTKGGVHILSDDGCPHGHE